jgi:8-oxo-dGTP pyrophosphatase MutT (NUDIX family)
MATNNIKSGCGALIYCHKTQRYLLLLRNGGRYGNTWGIVGGKIEKDESILDGLNREIQEELGGEIKNAKIIPIEQYTSDNGRFIYHTYLIRVDEEFVPVLNHEHKGYCWVRLEDHPTPLHPGVYKTFKFESSNNKLKTQEELKD